MAVEKGIEALATEGRNPETLHIDRMGTVEALETINRLDQEVAPAVARVIPSIAALVDAATDRMACGGRIIYMALARRADLVFSTQASVLRRTVSRRICLLASSPVVAMRW